MKCDEGMCQHYIGPTALHWQLFESEPHASHKFKKSLKMTGSFLKLSHDVSTSQLEVLVGHAMVWLGRTVQEAGAGGRSGPVGILVRGSSMGRFS